MRDFALVGAVTGVGAPAGFRFPLSYVLAAGLGGAVGGALLAVFTAWFLSGVGRRLPKWALVPLGGALGALWGAIAGAATGPGTPAVAGLSIMVASTAGAIQGGWFWPAYCYRHVNQRSTRRVVFAASIVSVVLGWCAVAVVPLLP